MIAFFFFANLLRLLNWFQIDNYFLIPGATVATILMLGALHARRLYDDTKVCVTYKRVLLALNCYHVNFSFAT